jgi:hypothetical protein
MGPITRKDYFKTITSHFLDYWQTTFNVIICYVHIATFEQNIATGVPAHVLCVMLAVGVSFSLPPILTSTIC